MRFLIWTVLLALLTTCSSPETPVADPPKISTYNVEAFIALSDSLRLQALYETTGLTPLPDTMISHGDTVTTIIQVLEYQPFNAPYTFTRIEGNNYDDEVCLNRFVIEHDKGCTHPLMYSKDLRPFEPSCCLVLEKSAKKILQEEWRELLQLIWDTDLTELAYLPRRGSLLDGDHLTLNYLKADTFGHMDFNISRGAPGEKSSLRMVVNFLNEL